MVSIAVPRASFGVPVIRLTVSGLATSEAEACVALAGHMIAPIDQVNDLTAPWTVLVVLATLLSIDVLGFECIHLLLLLHEFSENFAAEDRGKILWIKLPSAPAGRPIEVKLQRGVELGDDAVLAELCLGRILQGKFWWTSVRFSTSNAVPSAYLVDVAGKWASHVCGLSAG